MPTVPFTQTATVKLDGSGGGTAKLGPLSAREVWHDLTVSVSTNQLVTAIVKEAQCLIYAGDFYTKQFRDGCVDGSSGDSTTNVTDTIKVGSYVWATWVGGDPNVYASLTVTGMKDI